MAPRRNDNKIPVIDKTSLRESFNRGEDFLQLAKILGINRTTAYSIVNRDQDKERGDEMKTAIADNLESNPLLTFVEAEILYIKLISFVIFWFYLSKLNFLSWN